MQLFAAHSITVAFEVAAVAAIAAADWGGLQQPRCRSRSSAILGAVGGGTGERVPLGVFVYP